MGVVEDLARAREAYERREWLAAYASLSDVDSAAMTADDFARLATTAYLLGNRNDCVQAMQRAYQTHLDAADVLAAARCAFWLAMVLITSGEPAVGGGWVARCQRLLDDVPGDIVERGYLLVQVMYRYIFAGEFEQVPAIAEEITDYGRRFCDQDLVALGLNAQGRTLLYSGRVPQGLALLDEAMVGISAGEVSPIFAGQVYCSMIEACQEVGDFHRAAQWTSALTLWIDAQPGLVAFTGQCATHRGQIMRVNGAFAEAVAEFEAAVERYLKADTPAPAGLAISECGDVLRVRGELEAAATAYERAIGYGHEPQPGLALLWLARGRTATALAAVRRLLTEVGDPVHRARILPAAIKVLLACDEADDADQLSVELRGIAASFGCTALLAEAHCARGAVLLARGDAVAAVTDLRRGLLLWQQTGAPFEAAQCRLLIGRSLRALGDEQSALTELAAARRAFGRMGAVPAEREAARLLASSAPAGLTEREVEVLRLVASGRTNPEIAAALVLSEKTVGRHLSNILAKLGVSSRTAAAAFAYENGLV
jgi:DNA-binding CsgD family transcriptional regulator